MITISKKQFKEIQCGPYPLEKNITPVEFNGVYYPPGSIYCGFEGEITGKYGGCVLVYEHIHFEIEK